MTDKFYRKYAFKLQRRFTKLIGGSHRERLEISLRQYKILLNAAGTEQYDVLFFTFYGLGYGRLSLEFVKAYFEELHKNLDEKTKGAAKPGEELHGELVDLLSSDNLGGKRQHSFVSKLVHVIDNSFPIIDRNVRSFFHLKQKDDAASVLMLKGFYARFLSEKSHAELISKLKKVYPALAHVDDVKTLDFIIWSTEGGKKE